MDSTGALNGSLLNALPLNEGRFSLRASATLGAEAAATLNATRRVRIVQSASLAAAAVQCDAIRRRQSGAHVEVYSGSDVLLRRRRIGQASITVSVVALATANARLTASGSCLVTVDGAASLFWKYRLSAPVQRVARVAAPQPPVRVADESRKMRVPQEPGAAIVSAEHGRVS